MSFGQAMGNNNTLWTCSWVWAQGKSISSDAQYVTLGKYFSHPSLVLYSLATPPLKVKLGEQIGGGLINSKPLGPIIMMGQWKALSSNWIIFITLFSGGAQRCCPFYQPRQSAQYCGAKTIFLSQTRIGSIFFIQLYCADSHTKHCWRC